MAFARVERRGLVQEHMRLKKQSREGGSWSPPGARCQGWRCSCPTPSGTPRYRGLRDPQLRHRGQPDLSLLLVLQGDWQEAWGPILAPGPPLCTPGPRGAGHLQEPALWAFVELRPPGVCWGCGHCLSVMPCSDGGAVSSSLGKFQ